MQKESEGLTVRVSNVEYMMCKVITTRHTDITISKLVHSLIKHQLKGIMSAALSKDKVRVIEEIDKVYSSIFAEESLRTLLESDDLTIDNLTDVTNA